MTSLFHHDPDAANTAAAVTLTDQTDVTIESISWSYDGDGAGSLVVTLGAVEKLKTHITKGGPGQLRFNRWNVGSGAVVVTLAAIAAIKGTVSVEAR